MHLKPFIYLLTLGIVLSACSNDRTITSDVCIYGNSSASILAAIQLKKDGKSVVIVSPDQHLGGMTVEGLGNSDINNHKEFQNDQVIGGLTLEFYKKVANHYGIRNFDSARIHSPSWRFEPSVAEKIFEDWLEEYQIPVYRNHRLIQHSDAIRTEESKIIGFTTENGNNFQAKIFLDCSYEGDLLHYAGVSSVIGRESNVLYGERKNGIRAENTYRNFEVAVDPYIAPGDPGSGVIHTILNEPLGEPGSGDHRIQAYCFRACLTNDSSNRVPFVKPENYHREWYEIYIRYINAGGKLYAPYSSIPNQKTDLGAWHDLSHNLYGMNHAYPSGSYQLRDSIYQYHLDFTQGLFYFLANDEAVPDSIRNTWSQWGTTKDEFKDNNGWPRMIYIRDGRRMVSDYVLTEHHTRKDTSITINDPVGIAFWPPDVHHVRRIVKDGRAYNEGFVFGGNNWKPFQIPYRSLIPKRKECINLMTPTCISSSHIAFGAIRLEWTFMILGQSLGVAAGLCVDKNIPVQDLDYQELKEKLMAGNQVLVVE
jgi:hypothetical protein